MGEQRPRMGSLLHMDREKALRELQLDEHFPQRRRFRGELWPKSIGRNHRLGTP